MTTYPTVAAAEAALIADGYKRDTSRAMWMKPGAPSLKVIRTPENKFQLSEK